MDVICVVLPADESCGHGIFWARADLIGDLGRRDLDDRKAIFVEIHEPSSVGREGEPVAFERNAPIEWRDATSHSSQ